MFEAMFIEGSKLSNEAFAHDVVENSFYVMDATAHFMDAATIPAADSPWKDKS